MVFAAPGSEIVVTPYVSTANFIAEPTFIEVDNLVYGGTTAQNTDRLNDILIRGSQILSDFCSQPLHAHYHSQNVIMKTRSSGNFSWHPDHNPVQLISSFGYASLLSTTGATTFTSGSVAGAWIVNGTQVYVPFSPGSNAWSTIQFGAPGGEYYTQWTYVAGYPVTTLAAAASVGASSITVADPTGLAVGSILRLYEPGVGEAVTIGSTYVAGSTTVPTTTPLVNNHTAGCEATMMPSSIRQALINYASAMLMRPDATSEDQWPDLHVGISTRADDARKDGTGLVAEAYRLMRQFLRVR